VGTPVSLSKLNGRLRSPNPATMFTALGLGMVVILGNYLQLLPGGTARNGYLFLGLGLLIGGFVLSTQLR